MLALGARLSAFLLLHLLVHWETPRIKLARMPHAHSWDEGCGQPSCSHGVYIHLLSPKGQFWPLELWERTLAWFVLDVFLFVSSTGSKYPLKHGAQVNKARCLVLFTLYWHLHWPKEQKKITGHIWGLIKHCSRESFLSHYKHLLEVHLLI